MGGSMNDPPRKADPYVDGGCSDEKPAAMVAKLVMALVPKRMRDELEAMAPMPVRPMDY
jgi:hypothetical protein